MGILAVASDFSTFLFSTFSSSTFFRRNSSTRSTKQSSSFQRLELSMNKTSKVLTSSRRHRCHCPKKATSRVTSWMKMSTAMATKTSWWSTCRRCFEGTRRQYSRSNFCRNNQSRKEFLNCRRSISFQSDQKSMN